MLLRRSSLTFKFRLIMHFSPEIQIYSPIPILDFIYANKILTNNNQLFLLRN